MLAEVTVCSNNNLLVFLLGMDHDYFVDKRKFFSQHVTINGNDERRQVVQAHRQMVDICWLLWRFPEIFKGFSLLRQI